MSEDGSSRMSVSGLCEICETATVEDGCDRCGRLVCAQHYDEGSGLCTKCRAEIPGAGDGGGEEREGDDYPDGVGEHRF